MRRQILRFLQKRKFRLVTRWKHHLKEKLGSRPVVPDSFPYNSIFSGFDEIIFCLKQERPSLPRGYNQIREIDSEVPESIQIAHVRALYQSAWEVFALFLRTDPRLCESFSEKERKQFADTLESLLQTLSDRAVAQVSSRVTGNLSPRR